MVIEVHYWRYGHMEKTRYFEVWMMKQWITKEVKSTYGSSVWKTIRNLWHDFCVNVDIKVGDGKDFGKSKTTLPLMVSTFQ